MPAPGVKDEGEFDEGEFVEMGDGGTASRVSRRGAKVCRVELRTSMQVPVK